MKKYWRTIDKMALEAASFLINYCDMHDLCSDCIFHDDASKKCSIHMSYLSQCESFIEEVKRNV